MNIVYLRVSTNETEQDLKSQLNAIIDKYSLKEYEVLMDEGSAYNQAKIGKRTDFIKLLETLFNSENITVKDLFLKTFEPKDINLFVWDYSRIMRNIEMNLLFYLLTTKFNVKIISWKDNNMIDTTNQEITPSNRLMSILNYLLLSYSAEMYSSDISKNVSKTTDGEGYSIYGMKWGTYQANDNWKDFWSTKVVNNKGIEIDRVTSNNHLRITKEEDMKFKRYIKKLLTFNMRKEVIEIVKEKKGIILTPKFLSTLVRLG